MSVELYGFYFQLMIYFDIRNWMEFVVIIFQHLRHLIYYQNQKGSKHKL